MTSRSNILVTCGGKWTGIVLQLREALRRLARPGQPRIVVASSEPITPAGCFADLTAQVPPIRHPDYVDCLLGLCRREDIAVVLPLIDLDLERLAPHRHAFASEGTHLICPPPDLVELCLDKLAFAQFAADHHLPHPPTCVGMPPASLEFPAFYKRRRGFGSLGSGLCTSREQVETLVRSDPDLLFQPWIQAPELTVDAYLNRSGACILQVPRLRDKVVAGEVFKSTTLRHPAAEDLSRRTLAALATAGLRGPLNVQMFLTTPPQLLEVNTRIGSGVVLSNMATQGRLFEALLREAFGETVPDEPIPFQAGLHLSRFYGDVFHTEDQVIAVVPR